MNVEYAHMLTEFAQDKKDIYQQVLITNHDDIVNCFGGLDIMIQLSLTNPNFNNYMTLYYTDNKT